MIKTENLFDNYFNNSKLSHAYLFETDNLDKGLNTLLSISRMINGDIYNDKNGNNIENNDNIYTRIIRTESKEIKKEEIINLEKEFSTTSIDGKKRFYIIYEADKLNRHASNSLLKFLEEPTNNVVAFLLTTNKSKLLDTIISRCIFIKLNFMEDRETSEETKTFINELKKYNYLMKYKSSEELSFLNDKLILKNIFNEFIYYLDKKIDEDPDEDYLKLSLILFNLIDAFNYNTSAESILDIFYYEINDKNISMDKL